MELFRHELKKIIQMPALWIFAAVCIGFNMFLFFTDIMFPDYGAYVQKIAHKTGYVLNDEFYTALDNVSASELTYSEISESDWGKIDEKTFQNAQNLEDFIYDTKNVSDVFDDYDITQVAEDYIQAYGITNEWIADAMREKYKNTQPYVEQKAASNESLTLYTASYTYYSFESLFGTLMPAILMEGIVLAALITLFSIGYEHMNSAELVVYSTKRGRNVLIPKLGVSLLCGLAGYLIITIISLGIYFATHDYSAIWNSSISSCFNFISDLASGGIRPFNTYGSFTIWQYLLAVVGISLLTVVVFALMSFVIGMFQRNTYVAFGILLVVNAATVVALIMLSLNNVLHYILCLSPIAIWIQQKLWFTDGCENILCTHFETVGTLGSLVILAVICFVVFKAFKRRNII